MRAVFYRTVTFFVLFVWRTSTNHLTIQHCRSFGECENCVQHKGLFLVFGHRAELMLPGLDENHGVEPQFQPCLRVSAQCCQSSQRGIYPVQKKRRKRVFLNFHRIPLLHTVSCFFAIAAPPIATIHMVLLCEK